MVSFIVPPFTELDRKLLLRCAVGEDIKSSDRTEDQSRTKLKKWGYLYFDRPTWKWKISPKYLDIIKEFASTA